MTDELKLIRQIDRGEHAKRLLEDELLNEGLSLIRQNLHDKIEDASVRDVEGVMDAKRMLHITKELERHLKSVLNTGKMAKAEQDELQKRDAMLNKIHPIHGRA